MDKEDRVRVIITDDEPNGSDKPHLNASYSPLTPSFQAYTPALYLHAL